MNSRVERRQRELLYTTNTILPVKPLQPYVRAFLLYCVVPADVPKEVIPNV